MAVNAHQVRCAAQAFFGRPLVRSPGGPVLMVDAQKRGHRIVVKLPNQAEAWHEAMRLAVEFEARA